MRVIVPLLMLVPLAGCVAPDPTSAPEELRMTDAPPGHTCPTPSPPEEHRTPHGLLRYVWGCVAAGTGQDFGVGGNAATSFEVAPGTARLRALFHLHGGEPIEVRLQAPEGPEARLRDEAEHRDSYAVFDVPAPKPGPWRLRAQVLDLAVQRGWSATIELAR